MGIPKSGIYGANVPSWAESHFELVKKGKFQWAVIRSDSLPSNAAKLRQLDIEIVMQFPDTFDCGSFPPPGDLGREMVNALRPFAAFSRIVCLDNEPNWAIARSSNWYAEEFTRWYRALAASFRYWDRACHWQLVFPALIGHPERNFEYWLHISKENIVESEYTAVHCYWATDIDMFRKLHGRLYQSYHEAYPTKRLMILEYNSCKPGVTEDELCHQLPEYLRSLPDYVQCACYFILGGTEEWQKFFLTPRVAETLGRMQ